MPQDKRYRSGSAAAGGGMLTLWLTMRANAWLRQEWLSLLTETAAEGIGLVLQFLMLGIPLVVTIELLRRSAAQPCPLREGQNGSLWLVPAGLAVLLGANFLTLLLQNLLTGSGMSTPTPLPEEPLAIIFSMIGSVLLPAVMEELLFRGAVLHALFEAGPLKMNELAERIKRKKNTVTGLIGTLESRGYCRRETDPHDARAQVVLLTEKGESMRRIQHAISVDLLRLLIPKFEIYK